jgi:hypothetical protein
MPKIVFIHTHTAAASRNHEFIEPLIECAAESLVYAKVIEAREEREEAAPEHHYCVFQNVTLNEL